MGLAFITTLQGLIAEGLSNPRIAEALNRAGYRTHGKGVLWTWATVKRYRALNADLFEDFEVDRFPMPEYPRPKTLTEAEILYGRNDQRSMIVHMNYALLLLWNTICNKSLSCKIYQNSLILRGNGRCYMSKKRQGVQSLAKNVLAAAAPAQYNHLHLFLDGLKNPVEEANRLVVTCKKTSKPSGKNHARLA